MTLVEMGGFIIKILKFYYNYIVKKKKKPTGNSSQLDPIGTYQ